MGYKLKVPYNLENPGDVAQLECLRRALKKKRFGVFFQQRVGKTRVAIDFIGQNISEGARRVLVLCPLCAQAGWEAQLKDWFGNPGVPVFSMTLKKTTGVDLPKVTEYGTIVICTYDKASRMKDTLTKWKPDVVILDEAHLIKNRNSARSKMAYAVTRTASAVLGLTGTPYSNKKYADLFGMFRAINPSLFGAKWADFERKYCILGGYMGWEIVGYNDEEYLLETVDSNSMRVLRQDVMAEPEQEDVVVHVEMSKSEMKYYRAMEKDCVIYLEEQPTVTADMVTTQRLKLQQITSGTVKTDEGEYLEVSESKLKTTLDLINTIEGKVVVVCRYVADIKKLVKALGADYCVAITGGYSADVREAYLEVWRHQEKVRVLIVQEQTMSMGVDLSLASNMIFYSWGEDSVTHSQVKDRLMGRFQEAETVQYYYMVCDGTIDKLMYKSLKENVSFAEKAANWKKWVKDDVETI